MLFLGKSTACAFVFSFGRITFQIILFTDLNLDRAFTSTSVVAISFIDVKLHVINSQKYLMMLLKSVAFLREKSHGKAKKLCMGL
ncbi:hypothetical protein BKP45_04415 [Anaerobacillus alkalidiazotrophicus]|uniref:Uncharacterized protein n=1 Tax=Anaerobacillus alkalidiazotrophicus TaxID=472963 RepID=A0A1S2MB85_9BACI|nr:hypothetical protein BKP45_04415 [Anaerobacillus alkalidiazotrophicus]